VYGVLEPPLGNGDARTGVREVAVSATLPPDTVVALIGIGQLNVSRGVRRLLQAATPAPDAKTKATPQIVAPLSPQLRPQRPLDTAPVNVARLRAAKLGFLVPSQ
jgi:hypothetical protein